ncbi:universal stress protein [Streptomyces purpurogeneiscleroticus]|uniref:universal stress protein n=1 Tax=Streptomyces purpurogeneiscleroticus TaxID=68259 RepID=UPI001CBE28E2|nr:universal stress protein [Streptomyces purpurogeneiscleroticus]MBZ4019641.1 hypothetical protein [Streptomyces purpurogeneiscleroticus]
MTSSSHPPHGRVLVGYDGSPPAVIALDAAVTEARCRGAALEILCGWPWSKRLSPDYGMRDDVGTLLFNSAQRTMDAAVDRARSRAPDTPVTPVLTTEAAARALLRQGRNASLTVLGTRGYGGFAGLLLGSVSLRVAAHCVTPLMVVRREPEPPHRTIVLGLASEADTEALRFAFDEAVRRDAALRVLHTWQFPAPHGEVARPAQLTWEEVQALRKAAEAVPQYAVTSLREKYPQVRADAQAVCQDPARALIQASEEADVIVLAAHRRPRHFGLQLGPVTHALLHHARCPVVLVPSD